MSDVRTWTLTDVSERVWVEQLDLNPSSIAVRSVNRWAVRKRRLHGGLSEGVDIVEVDNGNLSFTVVPTRGMGLWRGTFNGNPIGWRSPVTGPVNPCFVNPVEQGGLGWLKGFDECIVRCGLNWNGAPCTDVVPDNNGNPAETELPLHGRIANMPAHKVDVQIKPGPPTELTVIGIVDEQMLFCPQLRLVTRIATVAGSNVVTISDKIINVRETPTEVEMLYHCNFGPPFLDEDSMLVTPSLEVAPRDARAAEDIDSYAVYAGPTPGYVEQVYWHEMAAAADGGTVAMLRNADRDRAVAIRYNVNQMPHFTQWKNTVGEREGYTTGLEPGTNLPNPKPFEREKGRVLTLQPGESYAIDFSLEVHDTPDGISGVEAEIRELLGGRTPEVHSQPVPKWSQVG
jgi:galactose mutarotase-like enzyme